MAIPTPTFGPLGFIIPADADILAAVQDEINAAFGGGLNMADETPQGQLAVSMTAAISNGYQIFQKYTQQVDPAYSDGRMQDGIARIYFIERLPSLPTTVIATCGGASGVAIPAGSRAVDVAGNIYFSTADAVIGAGGTVDVTFQNVVVGPIPCSAGTLTTIFQAIPGWDTITNAGDGVLGRALETRSEFEQRRALSVAQNANGSLPAILGALLNVSGVLDAIVIENVENTPATVGGVTLAPNSIYASVVGGADADVAKAIWSRKSPGCGYNGNTVVTVYDANPSYNQPYPAYSVSFERPASTTVMFDVSLATNSLVPADAATQVQNAIIGAFAGADGGPPARIGSTIYASRFYSAVAALGAWVQIVSIKIGCLNNSSAQFTGTIAGTALSVSAVASGAIAIGQTVLGANVLPGTTILSGSGTSWVVSKTQTISSPETMYGCLATLDDVQMDIAQAPAVSANDIVVAIS